MKALTMVLSFLVLLGASEIAEAAGETAATDAAQRRELLAARESVWHAWFQNDQARLRKLLPPDTLAINNGEEAWQSRDEILEAAARFAAAGSRLVRLEFPRTEIQRFGDVAVLYSRWEFEVETAGKREVSSGRSTEVFVRRKGRWVNPGWHLDSGR
jgi:ketosteroid isomerase-like protein